jgi:hypothetical protein
MISTWLEISLPFDVWKMAASLKDDLYHVLVQSPETLVEIRSVGDQVRRTDRPTPEDPRGSHSIIDVIYRYNGPSFSCIIYALMVIVASWGFLYGSPNTGDYPVKVAFHAKANMNSSVIYDTGIYNSTMNLYVISWSENNPELR